MLPARTDSPPKRLTPVRLASESRPLRVEPPAFYVPFEISPQVLGADASNFHISEPLTMALLLTIVFTTTKLNDFNFLATTVSNNFSFDYAAINERNADFDFFTVCDHQHFSELNSFASCDVQLFRANGLTFAYRCCLPPL